LYIQLTLDRVLVSADIQLLNVLAIAFAALLTLQVVTGLVRGLAAIALTMNLGVAWLAKSFAHMVRLPTSYFERRHVGDVVSRLHAVLAIRRVVTGSLIESLVDGLMAAAILSLMLFISPMLAVVSVAAVVAYVLVRVVSYRFNREVTEKQIVASAKLQSYVIETVRGSQTTKLASMESQRATRYTNMAVETCNIEAILARNALFFVASHVAITGVERIVIVFVGASLCMSSGLSVGMLVAFLAYREMFATRAVHLVESLVDLRMLSVQGERLADILQSECEMDPQGATAINEPTQFDITFDNVGFRHSVNEPWIIRNCSFHVADGDCVALTGTSGSGKSTILKLLLGLLTPAEGRILVGERDLAAIGGRALRRCAGSVMQDDQLFAGTIEDNIVMGGDDSQCCIESVAKLAGLHSDVVAMPMGYNTLVGDMGSALSGGQRQRVLFARALHKQPKLLVLDEATSHLDVGAEKEICDVIRKIVATRVIVAHRSAAIEVADRVLVVRDGRVEKVRDNNCSTTCTTSPMEPDRVMP
jgi:ATP-binding cassette, subfamily B, bacterial CvaB/MchF/RaxB